MRTNNAGFSSANLSVFFYGVTPTEIVADNVPFTHNSTNRIQILKDIRFLPKPASSTYFVTQDSGMVSQCLKMASNEANPKILIQIKDDAASTQGATLVISANFKVKA